MTEKKLTGKSKVIKELAGFALREANGARNLLIFFNMARVAGSFAQLYATQLFFDSLQYFADGSIAFGSVRNAFLLYVGISLLVELSNPVMGIVNPYYYLELNKRLKRILYRKAGKLSPICYEDTEILDQIEKAGSGAERGADVIWMFVFIGSYQFVYILGACIYMRALKPSFVFAILLAFLPMLASVYLRAGFYGKLADKSAPLKREYEYFEKCIVGREHFKETRLLGAFSFFRELYMDSFSAMQKERLKTRKKTAILESALSALSVLGLGVSMILVFRALLAGEILAGTFAVVLNLVMEFYSILNGDLKYMLADVSESAGEAERFLRFLKLPEREGAVDDIPKWGDIEMDGVSFSYPGAEEETLKDISFTWKKGETLAIVGENGSGKSTLVRLLCGMYLPDKGSVRMDGQDTRDYSAYALYKETSAVFQKYQRYQMTLRENIKISEADKEEDKAVLGHVLKEVGISPEDKNFPQGYDTMLSREFGGTDLSGGQWQRIALARGFYRSHKRIILDEPTAAIDPYEETRIYNRFAEIAKEKSAVIVTHRIGSVKLADRILVMKKGRLVQIGSHESLIKEDGEYRRMYESQEKWYQR